MSAVGVASENIDESTFRAILIRWKLAQMYLTNHPDALEHGRAAMEMLVTRDLPLLLREFGRRSSTLL